MSRKASPKIFYAGDSPAGGPANYLLAILGSLGVDLTHVPPGQRVGPELMREEFDGFILSDFSRKDLDARADMLMEAQVRRGAGLLMVGGWGSFAGPFGGWRGSRIESLLPVRCLSRDDRVNLATGLLVQKKAHHPMLGGLSFSRPPVLIGLNRIAPRSGARVLLTASPLTVRSGRPALRRPEYPLLVIGEKGGVRSVALATDLAPHWCGGWVDWGDRRCKLPVTRDFGVEVGHLYVRFVQQLVRWIMTRPPRP